METTRHPGEEVHAPGGGEAGRRLLCSFGQSALFVKRTPLSLADEEDKEEEEEQEEEADDDDMFVCQSLPGG